MYLSKFGWAIQCAAVRIAFSARKNWNKTSIFKSQIIPLMILPLQWCRYSPLALTYPMETAQGAILGSPSALKAKVTSSTLTPHCWDTAVCTQQSSKQVTRVYIKSENLHIVLSKLWKIHQYCLKLIYLNHDTFSLLCSD